MKKTLRGDRTAAERKIAALQPAAGGESSEQDFLLFTGTCLGTFFV